MNYPVRAIATKYLGPTNTRGSRIKASIGTHSITIPYPYECNNHQAHQLAAEKLAKKMGWGGTLSSGWLPKNNSYDMAHVFSH